MKPQLGKYGRDSQSAAHQHDLVALFQMGCHAQGTDEIQHGGSLRKAHHLICCFSHCLDDYSDRAFAAIVISDG